MFNGAERRNSLMFGMGSIVMSLGGETILHSLSKPLHSFIKRLVMVVFASSLLSRRCQMFNS
jgi:hypothetical protein